VTGGIELPASYLAMPRWWHEGEEWLAALPDLAAEFCAAWNLALDGAPMHGSNALVLPVTRDGVPSAVPLALRLTPPDDRTAAEVRALEFWNGRGTVLLHEADPARGVSLLERLDGTRPLSTLPLAEAMPVIGRLMRRLAVPDPPPDVPATADLVRDRLAGFDSAWERLGRPFARASLDAALEAGRALAGPGPNLAVNGDLHGGQVLPGAREPWLAVDPVLYRGDPAHDLARVLWTRLDEMADAAAIRHWLALVVDAAGLDPARARLWVTWRTVDYWLWGLGYGLTEDPLRCARLLAAVR